MTYLFEVKFKNIININMGILHVSQHKIIICDKNLKMYVMF